MDIITYAILKKRLKELEETIQDKLDVLQEEVDGNIQSFFGEQPPTAENDPAAGWSDAQKNKHLGDLYFIVTQGDSGDIYRWVVENGVYSWKQIPDTDATKALQQALQNAGDIANLQDQLETDENLITDVQTQAEQNKADIESLRDEVHNNDTDIDNLQDALAAEQETRQKADQELRGLLGGEVGDVSNLQQTVEQHTTEIQQIQETLDNKTTEQIESERGVARVYNVEDGGGAMFTDPQGNVGRVTVNDGLDPADNGIFVQMGVHNADKSKAVRINGTLDGFYYTKNAATSASQPSDQIATIGNIQDIQVGGKNLFMHSDFSHTDKKQPNEADQIKAFWSDGKMQKKEAIDWYEYDTTKDGVHCLHIHGCTPEYALTFFNQMIGDVYGLGNGQENYTMLFNRPYVLSCQALVENYAQIPDDELQDRYKGLQYPPGINGRIELLKISKNPLPDEGYGHTVSGYSVETINIVGITKINGNGTFIQDGKWHRYAVAFYLDDTKMPDPSTYDKWVGAFGIVSQCNTADIYVRNLQLQQGNKATNHNNSLEQYTRYDDITIPKFNLVKNLPEYWEQGSFNFEAPEQTPYEDCKIDSPNFIRLKEPIRIPNNYPVYQVGCYNTDFVKVDMLVLNQDLSMYYTSKSGSSIDAVHRQIDVRKGQYLTLAVHKSDNSPITPQEIKSAFVYLTCGSDDSQGHATLALNSQETIHYVNKINELQNKINDTDVGQLQTKVSQNETNITQLQADVANRTIQDIQTEKGLSQIINDPTGGILKYTTIDGKVAGVAVNDGAQNIYAELYAKEAQTNNGARVILSADKAFYTKGTEVTTTDDDEIVTTKDLKNINISENLVTGTNQLNDNFYAQGSSIDSDSYISYDISETKTVCIWNDQWTLSYSGLNLYYILSKGFYNKLKPSTEYTISFDIKVNDINYNNNQRVGADYHDSISIQTSIGTHFFEENMKTIVDAEISNYSDLNNAEWTKIIVYVTTPETLIPYDELLIENQHLELAIQTNLYAAGSGTADNDNYGQVYFKDLKIEQGHNENPIWTPSPQDHALLSQKKINPDDLSSYYISNGNNFVPFAKTGYICDDIVHQSNDYTFSYKDATFNTSKHGAFIAAIKKASGVEPAESFILEYDLMNPIVFPYNKNATPTVYFYIPVELITESNPTIRFTLWDGVDKSTHYYSAALVTNLHKDTINSKGGWYSVVLNHTTAAEKDNEIYSRLSITCDELTDNVTLSKNCDKLLVAMTADGFNAASFDSLQALADAQSNLDTAVTAMQDKVDNLSLTPQMMNTEWANAGNGFIKITGSGYNYDYETTTLSFAEQETEDNLEKDLEQVFIAHAYQVSIPANTTALVWTTDFQALGAPSATAVTAYVYLSMPTTWYDSQEVIITLSDSADTDSLTMQGSSDIGFIGRIPVGSSHKGWNTVPMKPISDSTARLDNYTYITFSLNPSPTPTTYARLKSSLKIAISYNCLNLATLDDVNGVTEAGLANKVDVSVTNEQTQYRSIISNTDTGSKMTWVIDTDEQLASNSIGVNTNGVEIYNWDQNPPDFTFHGLRLIINKDGAYCLRNYDNNIKELVLAQADRMITVKDMSTALGDYVPISHTANTYTASIKYINGDQNKIQMKSTIADKYGVLSIYNDEITASFNDKDYIIITPDHSTYDGNFDGIDLNSHYIFYRNLNGQEPKINYVLTNDDVRPLTIQYNKTKVDTYTGAQKSINLNINAANIPVEQDGTEMVSDALTDLNDYCDDLQRTLKNTFVHQGYKININNETYQATGRQVDFDLWDMNGNSSDNKGQLIYARIKFKALNGATQVHLMYQDIIGYHSMHPPTFSQIYYCNVIPVLSTFNVTTGDTDAETPPATFSRKVDIINAQGWGLYFKFSGEGQADQDYPTFSILLFGRLFPSDISKNPFSDPSTGEQPSV